jgi:hypothetical protein
VLAGVLKPESTQPHKCTLSACLLFLRCMSHVLRFRVLAAEHRDAQPSNQARVGAAVMHTAVGTAGGMHGKGWLSVCQGRTAS